MKISIEKKIEGLALDERIEYGYMDEEQKHYYGVYVYEDDNGWFIEDEEDAKKAIKLYNGDLSKMLLDISKSLRSEMSQTGWAARADIEQLWLKVTELEERLEGLDL